MQYHKKVELFEKNDRLIQLETSKSSIKDLFNDILDKKIIFSIK